MLRHSHRRADAMCTAGREDKDIAERDLCTDTDTPKKMQLWANLEMQTGSCHSYVRGASGVDIPRCYGQLKGMGWWGLATGARLSHKEPAGGENIKVVWVEGLEQTHV